jgi:hypothetical protein
VQQISRIGMDSMLQRLGKVSERRTKVLCHEGAEAPCCT